MAEHVFFPPQQVELDTCPPNIFLQAGSQSSGQSFSDQEHVHDNLQESTKLKSDIVSHPLYEQLLEAHISCICVGLPVDYMKAVEAQVANKQSVAMKYLILGRNAASQPNCSPEIDKFMESYLLLLHSFKKHLEDHLFGPIANAMAAYCEVERAFQELRGMSCGDTMGTPMDDSQFQDANFELSMEDFVDKIDDTEAHAKMHIERDGSLVDHVREELKFELKEGYLESITTVREEILRKRKAGKLPGGTCILNQWWNSHLKWPYPTDEEKRQMVKTTGLEMKQINNWFINRRKRNWNGRNDGPAASASNGDSAHDRI